MPGVGQDSRAGGLRVPGNIVTAPENLSPNVQALVDGFRKGWITGDDIRERYGQRAIAEDKARTAQANLATAEAEQLGPLQIQAKKTMLSPEMVALQAQAAKGGLEGQIAQQEFEKNIRVPKQRYQAAQLAQAYDELTTGIPAAAVRQLAFDFPNLVKPTYDANGVVTNKQEVLDQIAQVKNMQMFTDTMRKLAANTERQELTHADGSKESRIVIKGTNNPVTPAMQQAIWAAETTIPGGVIQNPAVLQEFQKAFGAPGQVTPPAAAAAAPQVGTPTAPAAPAPAAPAAVGTPTAAGGVITSAAGVDERQQKVIQGIQTFVQRSKPVQQYEIMGPYASQAYTLEKQIIPGSGRYSPDFEKNGKFYDHSLIFNYMKLVDPTSVVREGEFQYATKLSPLDDYFINKHNIKDMWLRHQIMTDSTRRAMLDRIKELTYATAESAAASLGSYADQAQREGISVDQAIGASNADLLRFTGKLPGGTTNIPQYLIDAKAFVGGSIPTRSMPSQSTDASGKPDSSQIITIKRDDADAIAKSKRTGGWFWIEGEPGPRRWK